MMNFEDKINGGVWACTPVSEHPEVVLTDWHVFEVRTPLPCTRHFAGDNRAEGEGRVSSPILEFDAATGRGVTRSGRVYELNGRTGFTSDGSYVWNRWKAINNAVDVVDVTAEVKAEMAAARVAADDLLDNGKQSDAEKDKAGTFRPLTPSQYAVLAKAASLKQGRVLSSILPPDSPDDAPGKPRK